MTAKRLSSRILAALFIVGCTDAVLAQQSQPASQPAGQTLITARVLEIRGDVRHAPVDSTDWKPCQVGDEYPQETVILTGVRSSAKLQIGTDDTYTALVIEPATKTLISQAYTTADTKRVNIGVGYGRIRAGVVEGGLKSDFTVECPVATLSKRGTWDFGLFYERGTDRFEIFLLDRGLIEAFNRITGVHRMVLPQELVTEVMRRWAEEAQFSSTVPIPDILGQGDIAMAFSRLQQDGLRVLNPEGGHTVLLDLGSAGARQQFASFLREQLPLILPPGGPTGAPLRQEGFFGTGRGADLVPLIIDRNSPLAQKGLAQPGTYRFPRAALNDWLERHGK